MIYILVALSISVFLLGSIVFGIKALTYMKKERTLSLAFFCTFIYSAFLFAIQLNGLFSCFISNTIDSCVHYPEINEIPIIQIGFNFVSENLKIFLINILTAGIVLFLVYFLRKQLDGRKK